MKNDITKEVSNDIKNLITLNLAEWKKWIGEETEEDEIPYNNLTIGLSDDGTEWSYQTGDNSYTGGAYCFPNWVVLTFTKETTPQELFEEFNSELDALYY